MTDLLLMLLGESPDAPLRWGRVRDGRLIEGGRLDDARGLAALQDHAAEASLVAALLPGEQVATRRLAAPPRDERKLRAAAEFLIEDELGEPIADLHVAVGADARGALAVAVRRRIVENWLEAFAGAGIGCALLSADYLALPPADNAAVVIFDGARVVAAMPDGGFAVETALFERIAAGVFSDEVERISVLGDAVHRRLLPRTVALEWLGASGDAALILAYAQAIAESSPVNLRQGAYRRRRDWRAAFAPWRRAAALAAALAALLLVAGVADGLRAHRIADRWSEAASAVHATAFPDAVGENPAAHARRVLAAGGGPSFLALSARFAEAVEATGTVEIERITFDAARGDFIVSVRSRSDADIEDLKQRLAALGVETRDSGGYRRAGADWVGELAARMR
ncbi:type II secretion system protein GspL [Amphiplicatus metriothermophilus]|uniref:Type II secretion system protein L (GspL) n=1 Tax=Amphiplicatus metriothermophilus TaxID=1519374 RepID=A0A239PQ72_9PROT|nr:type II secretion system protein GspL [Amphiplicatus metriothermophilus]MBB5518753.1 general secretion pathway protein L [Amphiplicatus metriothermophilus]SNT72092.1 type II secretion system protein L (GspL) [Amphiplicatus metriothermophilus]